MPTKYIVIGTLLAAILTACDPAGGPRQTAYIDVAEPVDETLVHSPRRADLLRISYFWQMDEPAWLTSLTDAEAYRLWYKPSLYDWSVVRVVRRRTGWVLSVRTLDSSHRRTLGKCLFAKSQVDPLRCPYPTLKTNRERPLQPQEVESFLRHLAKLDFWNQPEQLKKIPGFDGVDWVLEGMREDGRTHELYRYNPAETGAFYRFADYLLTVADVPRP